MEFEDINWDTFDWWKLHLIERENKKLIILKIFRVVKNDIPEVIYEEPNLIFRLHKTRTAKIVGYSVEWNADFFDSGIKSWFVTLIPIGSERTHEKVSIIYKDLNMRLIKVKLKKIDKFSYIFIMRWKV